MNLMTDRSGTRTADGELPAPVGWAPFRTATPTSSALWIFLAIGALLVLGRMWVAPQVEVPALEAWATIFVAISVQALPFLIFGVALSAAITAFVPQSFWDQALPRRAGLAVPTAAAAGVVLPGCECASVPVAGSLMSRGVAPSAALTFLLAAPAINPIVLVATVAAFPNEPDMALARLSASLIVAVLAGWFWLFLGKAEWLRIPPRPHSDGAPRWEIFRQSMRHDLMHAGGFLVVGGAAAATINVVVPAEWVLGIADIPWASVLTLAFLAVLMSICSEADAFVAASLAPFSSTAKLTFLVVGPMVDLKLIALQVGTFGTRFAIRFVPLTLALAVGASTAIGWWLL
jgi:uncharacterized protein